MIIVMTSRKQRLISKEYIATRAEMITHFV